MKSITLTLFTEKATKNGTENGKYTAELRLYDDTRFSEILQFQKDVKKLWNRAIKAINNETFLEFEITQSTYDNWLTDKPPKQTSFDRWYGTSSNQYLDERWKDEWGIYLKADEEYTAPERDIFLSRNVLEDLAEAL